MAAKKCKCGADLVLETDKVRGKCHRCVRKDNPRGPKEQKPKT